MKSAVILLFAYAAVIGIATFIENDFGIEGSWALVYNTKWFEILQLALVIIFLHSIFEYKLYRKEKLPGLMFHLGFVIILIGAAITRYWGYEGSLHIREGQMANHVLSRDSFVIASTIKDKKRYSVSEKKIISTIGDNDFELNLDVAGEEATVKYKEFIPNATKKVVKDEDGEPMVSMVLSHKDRTRSLILKEGERLRDTAIMFGFDNKVEKNSIAPVVNIKTKDKKFFFSSSHDIKWFKMKENTRGVYEAGEEYPFVTGQLYTIDETNFTPKFIGLKGKEKVVSDENPMQRGGQNYSALIVDVAFNGKSKEAAMFGTGKGTKGFVDRVEVGGQEFALEWGSKVFALPFSIKLNDFQLDRYPGSNSPMSYASEVEVVDKEKGVNMPFRIYMNHVLDYRGFRFFQSSYDKDEKGTILSVNKDPGKWPTYLGYFLLSLGLILNLLNPKSRFRELAAKVNKDTQRMKSFVVALAGVALLASGGNLHANEKALEYLKGYDAKHAEHFGEILVQSGDGRIKPIDTVSTEVLNKVYRKASYEGMSANQVVLSMMASPGEWQVQPFIHVFHPELKELIGLDPDEKKASFNDFFEKTGEHGYKLEKYAEEANRKKPAYRNKFDKDIIKVDERVNIVYLVYTGEIFKMVPKIGDSNHKWYSPKAAIAVFPEDESRNVRNMLAGYFDALAKGMETGDWSAADKSVERFKGYQEQYASEIMPSQSKIKAEMFFNEAQIFQKLVPYYLISGFVLLFAIFGKMLKPSISLKWVKRAVFTTTFIAFLVHTFGLGLRWYIAEHAPWSDGYESMIYIAWSLGLAGLFFSRQSIVSLSLTSILAGVTLFVAHLSWMDAQITNLVPVLRSYWLNIHVSVITASYGFLGLCALLGFFTLILFAVKKPNKKSKRNDEIDRNIVEATRINEMSMILGLSLLTIGNFLGGVWANESWGRYWGWDPKETWSLVSILVYAAIVHFRLVPKLNNQFAFAVVSTISYAAIIMTYFGVNFYLSGMHSYASGDPVPIPDFVYYTIAVVFIVIGLAFRNRKLSKTL